MISQLGLFSFIPINPAIESLADWNKRINDNITALDSLSSLEADQKYYFSEKNYEFYRSTWAISDHAKYWIGDSSLTQWFAKNEEAAYRTFWRLSIIDLVEGILFVKNEIIETLTIASRTLEGDSKIVSLDTLKRQVTLIQSKFQPAHDGLLKLKGTYETTIGKQTIMDGLSKDFLTDLSKHAEKILFEINAKISKRASESPPAASPFFPHPSLIPASSSPFLNPPSFIPAPAFPSLNPPSSPPPSLSTASLIPTSSSSQAASNEACLDPEIEELKKRLLLPFTKPKNNEEFYFNKSFYQKFCVMEKFAKEYLAQHVDKLSIREDQFERIKKETTKLPWSITAMKTGRIYFHYHIRIVPIGEGGRFKTDKRAYSYSLGCDIAKLSTKLYTAALKKVAKREAKSLLLCSQKKLPNIAETYDIIWIQCRDYQKQIIYQKFYSHGDLSKAIFRISQEPEKMKLILLGVLKGLAAIHGENIVHRDLKPANIMLDENDIPYITDFGFSSRAGKSRDPCGTPFYIDPSIITNPNLPISCHNDIWSIGMMMYAFLNNPLEKIPWKWLEGVQSIEEVIKFTLTKKHRYFPKPSGDDIWMLVCWEALQLNPKDRPTAQQMLDRLSN